MRRPDSQWRLSIGGASLSVDTSREEPGNPPRLCTDQEHPPDRLADLVKAGGGTIAVLGSILLLATWTYTTRYFDNFDIPVSMLGWGPDQYSLHASRLILILFAQVAVVFIVCCFDSLLSRCMMDSPALGILVGLVFIAWGLDRWWERDFGAAWPQIGTFLWLVSGYMAVWERGRLAVSSLTRLTCALVFMSAGIYFTSFGLADGQAQKDMSSRSDLPRATLYSQTELCIAGRPPTAVELAQAEGSSGERGFRYDELRLLTFARGMYFVFPIIHEDSERPPMVYTVPDAVLFQVQLQRLEPEMTSQEGTGQPTAPPTPTPTPTAAPEQ